jgi:hypothetical protein
MGIYSLYMGKGLILPCEFFVRKYLKQIKADFPGVTDADDATEVLNHIVKKYIGDYEVCSLGHDALEVRGGGTSIAIGTSDNLKVVSFIKKWRKMKAGTLAANARADVEEEDEDSSADILKQTTENIPFSSLHVGDLMFLGKFKSINGDGEFNYYVKAPEIIYGLAGLLEDITDYYPKLVAMDCSDIESAIGLKPCIWTFAPDCACCG